MSTHPDKHESGDVKLTNTESICAQIDSEIEKIKKNKISIKKTFRPKKSPSGSR